MLRAADHMRLQSSLSPLPGQRTRGAAEVPHNPPGCTSLGLQHWRKSDEKEAPGEHKHKHKHKGSHEGESWKLHKI